MKITLQKTVKTEIDLPEFFKLAHSEWYYAVVDAKTLLHVKMSSCGYPLIEQVEIGMHSGVITSNEVIEVTEKEFKDKFSEAYLKLSELSN
jgi:hypothetical protein